MIEYKIEYFKRKEFSCPCCGEDGVSEALVLWLDLLRRAWGGPVAVNSGRRCAAHNAKVGGSERSRHLIGCAADIRALDQGARMPRRAEFAALASRLCCLPGWEFRLYGTFIHIAAPRAESVKLWQGPIVLL
ncbi:MAG: hypothetical protein LBO82_07120 [Synergistaceae bacterium]|jgi:hypothetical protein|nr:hypothetical protein [Synergistaceae bacterium]